MVPGGGHTNFPQRPLPAGAFVGPKQCQQLLAALPLPSCQNGKLAGHAGRGDGQGRAGVAARCHSIARPFQPPEQRDATSHPHSAEYAACLCFSATRRAAPSDSAAHGCVWLEQVSGETKVALEQEALPSGAAPWIRRSSRRLPAGSTCGVVVWANHCCGTTCPSNPTASRATRTQALSTTLALQASSPARGRRVRDHPARQLVLRGLQRSEQKGSGRRRRWRKATCMGLWCEGACPIGHRRRPCSRQQS